MYMVPLWGGGKGLKLAKNIRIFALSANQKEGCTKPVLRIRDGHPGSRIRLFFHPGSRIRTKEFKYFIYFNPKKWFLSSRKYDPGCSSRIPDPDADFPPIPDPGSRGQKGTGSRIRNTVKKRPRRLIVTVSCKKVMESNQASMYR
jgi:hypothetical protein